MTKRKKREKKADFVKTKLKVGKTKPKPANYTDTSFKSRSINLPSQTLDNAFLEGEARRSAAFDHQLGMTKHYSENQRKDAVVSLRSHLEQNLTGPNNATSLSPLINHLAPLILDTSSAVRSALLELLGDLSPSIVPREALFPHLSILLLYIQSAMTHIHPPIRNDSTKFLGWTLDVGGEEVVREGWCKLLEGFAGLLGWSVQGQEKVRIQLSRGGSILGNVVLTSRHVNTLYTLLATGLSQSQQKGRRKARTLKYGSGIGHCNQTTIQHPLLEAYLLPTHSAPFAYLNLFTSPLLTKQQSSHDIPSRCSQFTEYIPSLLNYLHDLTAELGPDLGRQGNQVQVDELRVAIVRILGLVKVLYREEGDEMGEPGKGGKVFWEKEWRRCVWKVRSLIEGRSRGEGSRKVIREWDLAGLESDS